MREFELNSEVAWEFGDDPPEKGRPFFGLIEEDTCDPTLYPGVLLMVREQDGRYRLLDFDPAEQEEYLRTNSYCIQAFRYMTNHAGAFAVTETNAKNSFDFMSAKPGDVLWSVFWHRGNEISGLQKALDDLKTLMSSPIKYDPAFE